MERKHRSQMSQEEIMFAETLVHGIREWNFAVDHIMDRMAEKNIKKQDAVNALRYGDVIEVNDKGRVVMRLMKGMMKGTCVVASIHDRVLVTTWFNKGSDNHSTLNKSEYTWKVNVIEYLKSLQGEPNMLTFEQLAETFSPGEAIKEELEERGWSQRDLAAIMGVQPSIVNGVIKGTKPISLDLARNLAAAFGTSTQFWVNMSRKAS